MATELKAWQLNAKKWRKENGLTTPEWEMYVAHTRFWITIWAMIGTGWGICYGSIFL